MPNELQKKGGSPSKPVRYACLWHNSFYQGIVTQRNPLRSNLQHIEEEFYGNQVCFIDGLNSEVSSRLTAVRRPGTSPYNSQTFPAINRFYENRTNTYNVTQTFPSENIQVIIDTASVVYDATGPSTKTILFTKTPGAGSTYFQSVGNALYFTDGVDLKKYLTSSYTYGPSETFTVGQWILDPNGNIQSFQSQSTVRNITAIAVVSKTLTGGSTQTFLIVTFSGTAPSIPSNQPVAFSGLTTYTALNGQTLTYSNIPAAWGLNLTNQQIAFSFTATPYPSAADTGTASTYLKADSLGNPLKGVTGTSAPAWSTTPFAKTQDNTVTWTCYGPPVEDWGIAAPSVDPTVAPGPGIQYWTPNTTLGTTETILDSNGILQVLVSGGGVTGNQPPVWSTTVGTTTTDNTAVWQNIGSVVSWIANYNYNTTSVVILDPNGNIQWAQGLTSGPLLTAYVINGGSGWNTTDIGAVAGGTGTVSVSTSNYVVTGVNIVNPGNTYTSANGVPVTDTTGGGTGLVINITAGYLTGSSQPTWNTTVGGTTTDNGVTWTNLGPGTQLVTGTVQYAYSYHGLDGTVTDASSEAQALYGALGPNGAFSREVTVEGTTNQQVDQIWIWRTTQGGSTLFYLDSVPNPGTNTPVVYNDTLPDSSTTGGPSLNEFIEAPIALSSSPPPIGLTSLAFHLGCIFGAVGNTVQYSDGPLVTSGNGNTAWNPENVFVFPSQVVRLFPTSNGLMVFTTSDIYIIAGLNTAASPLYAAPFLQYIGLVSYDAFTVNGGIVFLYTSDNQIITLDPSSGVSEVGFPIGDQFGPGYGTGTFNPTSAHVTWHIAQSQDKGLYVSDFSQYWWRMCPTPSPESGTTWSPIAQIIGGFSAVQSVETAPGTHNLLLGPQSLGPILLRNYQVYSDNGSAYPAYAVLGSLVLAQPGQLAEVESFTTDSIAIGSPISLAVQLDEISSYTGLSSAVVNAGGGGYAVGDLQGISGGTGGIYKVTSISGGGSTGPVNGLKVVAPGELYPASQTGAATTAITGSGVGLTVNTLNGGLFETLTNYVQDPTQVEPSITLYAQRFYLSQTQDPAVCRHLQILINWGTDSVKNELLSLSLFGSFSQEK